MSMSLSHLVPTYPSPSPCPQVYSLCLCLYSCPAPRLFRTMCFFFIFFFRFYIYVLAYSICFSLSDLLHSVWQSLGPTTSLQITQFRFFLWLSNIPLYICVVFCGKFFCIYWDDHMVFLLQFVNMVDHIDWFVYSEESLHSWDKSHLIMVYDSFNVLLDSVC